MRSHFENRTSADATATWWRIVAVVTNINEVYILTWSCRFRTWRLVRHSPTNTGETSSLKSETTLQWVWLQITLTSTLSAPVSPQQRLKFGVYFYWSSTSTLVRSLLAGQHDYPVLLIPACIKCEIWVGKAKQLTPASDTQNSEHSHLKSTKLISIKATK